MLDHVFTDAIGALRDAFESARLERLAAEERFQADVLLGDVSWETSYGLPGEGSPPRVRADVSLVWDTWSQAAYRSWYVEEDYTEPPHILIEIVLRVQWLAEAPDPALVLDVLPVSSPEIGSETLARKAPTVECVYGLDLSDQDATQHAIDISYEGEYELDESGLSDGAELDKHFNALGGWIASMLVRLGDLDLRYKPTVQD